MLLLMDGAPEGTSRRSLLDEVLILTVSLSTLIILVIQIVSLILISYSMGASLRQDAARVADELASILAEPMYNIDDPQAIRIAESMLASGRLSGIELVSTATGTLFDEKLGAGIGFIGPIRREIYQGSLLLGTVTLYYSDADLIMTRNRFVFLGLFIIAAVVAVNLFINRFILQKRILLALSSILNGIGSIRMGDYTTKIQASEYTDVGVLVNLINEMSASILIKNSQLVDANTLLECRVAERTEELTQSLAGLQQAQNHLVESEKLSALGLLAAGMAHELNSPLGAIISSNRSIMDFFDTKMCRMQSFLLSLTEQEKALLDRVVVLGEGLSKSLDSTELSRARRREIIADMETLGIEDPRDVAAYLIELGIDSEDPVLRPLLRERRVLPVIKAASELLVSRRMAEIIDVAGRKAATVVAALRYYLSAEHEDKDSTVDLGADIGKILTLMDNLLKHGVKVRREFLPARTKGSSDKLGQVWMNLIRNAVQAMEFKGEVVVRTETIGTRAIVSVIDSGPGIPEDILPRIFDPFFTTKKPGEGMGLGLGICHRIEIGRAHV